MFTATVSIALEDFALSHALRAVPETHVEAERLAGHSRHWVMPCLWVTSGDPTAFEEALSADPTVSEVVASREYDDETYYQVNWSEEIKERVDLWLDEQGALLHAEADDDGWQLSIRFASREQFERFRTYLSDQRIGFQLEELTRASAPQQSMGGLTGPQRDALVVAVEEGYFAIPREATMDDVARALDVSTQAASERLRRAVQRFVETMLVVDESRDATASQ